ncbi:CBS domain-containing protein [Paracoccus sp. EGI L200073]|nr:CBS domain-containing protein [Paracoccus salsus]MCF3974686.1 CBS domain-containing protein [Paracoccus salsus]
MSCPIVSVAAATTIAEAAARMQTHGVGTLPVFEDDRPIGIVTDRDIVTRALAAPASDLGPQTRIADIMSSDVLTCFADQDVTQAAALMGDRQVRRLVVIDRSGMPVGILSVGDIAEHVSEELAGQVLGEISEARARLSGGPAPHVTRPRE